MSELYRVLKANGKVLFLEHGISPDSNVAKWQQRLDWCQRFVVGGCSLTLDVGSLFSTQSFRSVSIDNFVMEQTPATHAYMYRGTAIK